MPRRGEGPIPARIMLVGEAWGEEEERRGQPFVGASGAELNRLLHEAGLLRAECYVTNVVNQRPQGNDIGTWIAMKKKDRTLSHVQLRDRWVLPIVVQGLESLQLEIETVQPTVIIAFGNVALWALTGEWGIRKWRGSMMRLGGAGSPTIIPTIHPAAVLRQWDQRPAVLNDLRRAARCLHDWQIPQWHFIVRPSFSTTMETLAKLQAMAESSADVSLWLDVDLETRAGHIACCGLSWSRLDGISIPFMCLENREGYWSVEEEAHIVFALWRLLTHPQVLVRWQNGLYDAQYIYRWWHFIPRHGQDTMISQHALFSAQPKSLAYLASIYADYYRYWKDEGKTWDKNTGEDQLWSYNLEDCVYTRECGEVLMEWAKRLGLLEVHEAQQRMFMPVLRAMIRGVRVVREARDRLAAEVEEQIAERTRVLYEILGHPINPRSPLQMQNLFYRDLAQPEIRTRAKKGVPSHLTCDDEALQKIAAREPLMRPLVNCIADIRTLEIFLGNFILAPLDYDGRMRCSYNIGGSESGASAPKTYRLSSSKNAFGSGTNLQNIPSEKSKSVGKAAQRGHLAMLGDPYSLPNVRSLFGPDAGFTFFDLDLDRADLQVVVWESDDQMLKAALALGADIHLLNVFALDGKDPPPLEELVETHPKYPDHRGPRKYKREFAKVFCHATDYLGQPRTVAAHTGRLVAEVDRAQKLWFGAHPGIKRWHERVIEQVSRHKFVENKFGYRWYIFDRLESIMPEAVAWIPQSTVSIVINRIWEKIDREAPEIQVLLQVHDSLAGQFPTHRKAWAIEKLKALSPIVIPYEDPLIIPTGIGTSETSWGDC